MSAFPQTLHTAPGVTLTRDPSRLLLAFKDPPPTEAIASAARGLGLVLDETEKEGEAVGRPLLNLTAERVWVHTPTGQAAPDDIVEEMRRSFPQEIEWAGPVYRVEGQEGPAAFVCPLPHVLMIKPVRTDPQSVEELTRTLEGYGLVEVPEKSKYLGPFRYFRVKEPRKNNVYDIRTQLLEKERKLVAEVNFESMPMVVPIALVPNDTLYAQQWNMTRIQAGGAGTTGWDMTPGVNTIVICVLDTGCDLTHPDLQFAGTGINLGTMSGDGSPTGNHGTACAGVAAAAFNNLQGVAGVAGGCRILPVAFVNWTDTEVAAGINYAVAQGARVISMSFGWDPWNHAVIDPAIQAAHNAGVVMCVATHNYNGAITYPATNPLVIACGASDEIDNRKSPTSPDGETWGSDFGPEIAVVAPGVHIPTTDRQGNVGYNKNLGTPGDYHLTFNGTSAATPHVAGLAALLLSEYPTLTNVEVRRIIERSAAKVGTVPYTDAPGHQSGTWNQEMGYGRIDVWQALDFADVMIRDYPADPGLEPSTPPGGDFWDFSDIAVRATDDGVFVPGDPFKSSQVERGQTNYIYVSVRNKGPNTARNVAVNVRITPYVGLDFAYPADWTLIDANHVSPAPITATFATIPAGGSALARFSVSAAQVEDLWGWQTNQLWHPCMLASVTAANDYAFASATVTGNVVPKRNNFAQRNLSVVDVVAGATVALPFVVGNALIQETDIAELVIEQRRGPKLAKLTLGFVEKARFFPTLRELEAEAEEPTTGNEMLFLDRTRIETGLGAGRGVMVLERGSRLTFPEVAGLKPLDVKGGEVVMKHGVPMLEIRDTSALVRFEKRSGRMVPLVLRTTIPASATRGDQFLVRVSVRRPRGETTGGAGVLYRVR